MQELAQWRFGIAERSGNVCRAQLALQKPSERPPRCCVERYREEARLEKPDDCRGRVESGFGDQGHQCDSCRLTRYWLNALKGHLPTAHAAEPRIECLVSIRREIRSSHGRAFREPCWSGRR